MVKFECFLKRLKNIGCLVLSVLNNVNYIYKGIKQVVQDVVNLLKGGRYINKSIEFCSNILDNDKSLTNEL